VKKPKLLLLDADVIVFANQYGVWTELKKSYEVYAPSIVIEEAKFFETENVSKGVEQRVRVKIDLKAEERAGQIARKEASALDIKETFKDFDSSFLAALQDGEKEGIAVLKGESDSGLVFCTGDTAAIQAIGMLDLSNACISFEKMLELAGLSKLAKPLLPSLTEKSHSIHVARGRERRITGECFKISPLGL
jgi:hypothetical protein